MKPRIVSLLVLILLSMSAASVLANPGDLLVTYYNPDPTNDYDGWGDRFSSMEAIGNNVLVGAFRDVMDGTVPGAAYMFDGSTGTLLPGALGTIHNPTPNYDDRFGLGVAAVGSNFAVGAYLDGTAGTHAGAAYLFDSATGTLLHTFLGEAANDHFSYNQSCGFRATTALGNDLVLGAMGNNSGASMAGAVYRCSTTTGELLLKIPNPDPHANDNFGAAVTTVGDKILVGAQGVDSTTGKAYLFDGSTGKPLLTIDNPTPQAGDYFGYSVAGLGSKLVVSAPDLYPGSHAGGVVYVFDGTSGNLLLTIPNPTPDIGDEFGHAFAVVGNEILVGAHYDGTDGYRSGMAYLFDGDTGNLLLTIHNPTPNADDLFGNTVAPFGTDFLIGAVYDDTDGTNAGIVYRFQGVPEPGSVAMLAGIAVTALLYWWRKRA